MPRISAAAVAVAHLTPRRPGPIRLATPPELTAAEAAIWQTVIESLPGEFFAPEQAQLLAQYCRVAARLAEIERALRRCRLKDTVNYDRLARLSRQESASFLRLARALRLTPQSRLKAETAGRRADQGGAPRIDFSRLEEDE